MESLLKPVTLSPDVDRVLGEIRAGAENALYGAGSVESEELFHKHVASLIEGAGLPALQVMHYRWFLRELARLWRTRQGRDLAFHLELCIRKWVGLGLEPRTLQFLVCESYERLKGKDLTTKTQSHQAGTTMNDERGTMNERTKDAKIAKPGSDSDTGILESSTPGPLSSSTPEVLS